MIAVIFELIPKPGHTADYFDAAAGLRPLLNEIDGFISIERFKSLTDSEKYLSLSFWRDEVSIAEWRNSLDHRAAQTNGRHSILQDYRLRVANVIRDYGMHERDETPSDSLEAHNRVSTNVRFEDQAGLQHDDPVNGPIESTIGRHKRAILFNRLQTLRLIKSIY